VVSVADYTPEVIVREASIANNLVIAAAAPTPLATTIETRDIGAIDFEVAVRAIERHDYLAGKRAMAVNKTAQLMANSTAMTHQRVNAMDLLFMATICAS
jgi:hypothetical protein